MGFAESQFAAGTPACGEANTQLAAEASRRLLAQASLNGATYNSLLVSEFHRRPERERSFDVLASMRMFRYDMERFGRVLPETRHQVCNEELSLIAEAVDRASLTEFPLRRQGDDLSYFKNGEWRSYTGMLLTGKAVADREAAADPRRQFLADDAAVDLLRGYRMRKLQPGEQLVWCSPYRKDVELALDQLTGGHGADFLKECGRFPERAMGFICRAYCNADGDVILQSQTVDRSTNSRAIEAVTALAATDSTVEMPALTAAYDAVLHAQDPTNEYFAGRLGAEVNENAYREIQQHRDLVQFFLDGIEQIARLPISERAAERQIRIHMYGVWAAFKNRLDGVTLPLQPTLFNGPAVAHAMLLQQEVNAAFSQFVEQGKPMLGCGGRIEILKGLDNILNADPQAVADAIFEQRSQDLGPDGKGPIWFKCTNGHWNKRPLGGYKFTCWAQNCHNSVCAPDDAKAA